MKNTATLKGITDAVAAYRWMSDQKSIKAAQDRLSTALDGTDLSPAVRSTCRKLKIALESRWTAEQSRQPLVDPEHAAVLDRIDHLDNEIDGLLDELKQFIEGD